MEKEINIGNEKVGLTVKDVLNGNLEGTALGDEKKIKVQLGQEKEAQAEFLRLLDSYLKSSDVISKDEQELIDTYTKEEQEKPMSVIEDTTGTEEFINAGAQMNEVMDKHEDLVNEVNEIKEEKSVSPEQPKVEERPLYQGMSYSVPSYGSRVETVKHDPSYFRLQAEKANPSTSEGYYLLSHMDELEKHVSVENDLKLDIQKLNDVIAEKDAGKRENETIVHDYNNVLRLFASINYEFNGQSSESQVQNDIEEGLKSIKTVLSHWFEKSKEYQDKVSINEQEKQDTLNQVKSKEYLLSKAEQETSKYCEALYKDLQGQKSIDKLREQVVAIQGTMSLGEPEEDETFKNIGHFKYTDTKESEKILKLANEELNKKNASKELKR